MGAPWPLSTPTLRLALACQTSTSRSTPPLTCQHTSWVHKLPRRSGKIFDRSDTDKSFMSYFEGLCSLSSRTQHTLIDNVPIVQTWLPTIGPIFLMRVDNVLELA
jgi:hypothetical protein